MPSFVVKRNYPTLTPEKKGKFARKCFVTPVHATIDKTTPTTTNSPVYMCLKLTKYVFFLTLLYPFSG